jgi:hypothetical protein
MSCYTLFTYYHALICQIFRSCASLIVVVLNSKKILGDLTMTHAKFSCIIGECAIVGSECTKLSVLFAGYFFN